LEPEPEIQRWQTDSATTRLIAPHKSINQNQEIIMQVDLIQLAQEPIVQLVAALLLSKFVPQSLWLNIPVVGPFIGLAVERWQNEKLAGAAQQQGLLCNAADLQVTALEQLKRAGKVDSATAFAKASIALMDDHGLSRDEAAVQVEAAVNRLGNSFVLGQAVSVPAFNEQAGQAGPENFSESDSGPINSGPVQ
jgi:hypothetical protein